MNLQAIDSEQTAQQAAGQHVLLVEDHPRVLGNISQLFRDKGWRVHCARDEERMVDLLLHHDFDLMLCDLYMPIGDIRALLDWACTEFPALSVIAISNGQAFYDGYDLEDVNRSLQQNTTLRSALDPQLSMLLAAELPCFCGLAPAAEAFVTETRAGAPLMPLQSLCS